MKNERSESWWTLTRGSHLKAITATRRLIEVGSVAASFGRAIPGTGMPQDGSILSGGTTTGSGSMAENFSSRSVERIVGQHRGVRASAAYAVPDSAVGDRVMVALELHEGHDFDPAEFDRFLDNHPDLSPKWRPSFVRLVKTLPVLASLKVDKRTLRRQAWECDDPIWWRESRDADLILLGQGTVASLRSLLHRSAPPDAPPDRLGN